MYNINIEVEVGVEVVVSVELPVEVNVKVGATVEVNVDVNVEVKVNIKVEVEVDVDVAIEVDVDVDVYIDEDVDVGILVAVAEHLCRYCAEMVVNRNCARTGKAVIIKNTTKHHIQTNKKNAKPMQLPHPWIRPRARRI